jgi:hypothetical protein
MNYLVVSSDAYNQAFGDKRVIAVEVAFRAVYEGTYREPIVDAGTADRIIWVARSAMHEQVAELHSSRHQAVAAQIRELIGNSDAKPALCRRLTSRQGPPQKCGALLEDRGVPGALGRRNGRDSTMRSRTAVVGVATITMVLGVGSGTAFASGSGGNGGNGGGASVSCGSASGTEACNAYGGNGGNGGAAGGQGVGGAGGSGGGATVHCGSASGTKACNAYGGNGGYGGTRGGVGGAGGAGHSDVPYHSFPGSPGKPGHH